MFVLVLLLFIALNLLVAHVRSDCGLAAVLGRSGCADDIVRAGFPIQFVERGGLIGRDVFDTTTLVLDIIVGIGAAIAAGLIGARSAKGAMKPGHTA
jgi:hypothetical protein